MANSLFDAGREGFLTGEIRWTTSGIKAALIRSGTYTYSAAHKFVSEVTGAGAVIASTTAQLTSKTATAGVADAADPVFPAVAAGPACSQIVIYQSTAVGDGAGSDVAATAQRLIGFIDNATNLPITPSGIDIKIVISNGPDRIFKL